MALLIRKYQADDFALVPNFFSSCAEQDNVIAAVSFDAWRRFIGQEVNRDGADFIVAIDNGKLIGLVTSSYRIKDRDFTRHFRIIVAPDYRRKGIGTRLLKWVTTLDDKHGKPTYQSVCPASWSAASAFLHWHGFQEVERELQMDCLTCPVIGVDLSQAKMRNDIRIRKVESPWQFAHQVAILHNLAYIDDVAFVASNPEAMTDLLKEGYELWIAEVNDNLIAYCLMEPAVTTCWIESLAVHPHYRQQKIGYYLCATAISHAMTGNVIMRLQVSSKNLSAIALYEKLGFKLQSESLRLRATLTQLNST